MNVRREVQYQCSETAFVRAARYTRLAVPLLPDVSGDSPEQVRQWHGWLQVVWGCEAFSEVVEQASPAFARHMDALCASTDVRARQLRRTVVSVVRYLQRLTGRATPNGLFAGVAPAAFAQSVEVRWGPWHRAVASADASWMTKVVEALETCPEVLRRLPVVASNTPFVRGDRLIIPYPPRSRDRGRPKAEVSLRFTSAVQLTLDSARTPIPYDVLVDKVRGEFAQVPVERIRGLITALVQNGALVSALQAPSTTLDPLDHVLEQLEAVDAVALPSAAPLVDTLRAVRDAIEQHNHALAPAEGRRLRRGLRRMMAEAAAGERPLAVDLRLDCSLALPREVAFEAEKAATALARLSPAPFGTSGWKDFHGRFFERFGIGSLVPLRDVTDPDVGLGFPAGYLDSAPEQHGGLTNREQRLLKQSCEYIVWGTKGPVDASRNPVYLPGLYQASQPRKGRCHITQKPIEVMQDLVKICPPAGTVLDPFSGSGSTGVAALREGRQFVGIELSDHYAAIAEERLQQALTQEDFDVAGPEE